LKNKDLYKLNIIDDDLYRFLSLAKKTSYSIPPQNNPKSSVPTYDYLEVRDRVFKGDAACTSVSFFISLSNRNFESIFVPGHALNQYTLKKNRKIAIDFFHSIIFLNDSMNLLSISQVNELINKGEKVYLYNFKENLIKDQKWEKKYFEKYKFNHGYYKFNSNIVLTLHHNNQFHLPLRVYNLLFKSSKIGFFYIYYGNYKDIISIYLFRVLLFICLFYFIFDAINFTQKKFF
jgi:hypothetical protein